MGAAVTKEEVPGEVVYWLSRATNDELECVKRKELAKIDYWATRWMLVIEIDKELDKRRSGK